METNIEENKQKELEFETQAKVFYETNNENTMKIQT